MWHKTMAGTLAGLLVMVLIPSILCLWFNSHINLILAISLVLGLTLWAGVLTWCYAADSCGAAWKRAGWISVPTLILYGLTYFMTMQPMAGAVG